MLRTLPSHRAPWPVLLSLALFGAAGLVGCNDLGSRGEKGATYFTYQCVSARDSACADDPTAGVDREPDRFPSPIAVGATFRVHVGESGLTDVGRALVTAASPDFLETLADEGDNTFVARRAGDAGLKAYVVAEGRILDTFHVRLAEPEIVSVECQDLDTKTGTLRLPVSDKAVTCWLRARNATGRALAGVLRARWSTGSSEVLGVTGPAGVAADAAAFEEVSLRPLTAGNAELVATLGERRVSLAVEVTP